MALRVRTHFWIKNRHGHDEFHSSCTLNANLINWNPYGLFVGWTIEEGWYCPSLTDAAQHIFSPHDVLGECWRVCLYGDYDTIQFTFLGTGEGTISPNTHTFELSFRCARVYVRCAPQTIFNAISREFNIVNSNQMVSIKFPLWYHIEFDNCHSKNARNALKSSRSHLDANTNSFRSLLLLLIRSFSSFQLLIANQFK